MGKRTKKTNDLFVSVSKFDLKFEDQPVLNKVYANVPINEARGITIEDYQPYGGTPLNDATLLFLAQLDSQYKKNKDAIHIGLLADESGSMSHLRDSVVEGFNTFIAEVKADKRGGGEPGVMVVIMTDGVENASTEDPQGDKVREVIKQKEADGWNFFYLGANQDAWSTGNNLGLGQFSHSFTYDYSAAGVSHAHNHMASMVNTRKSSTKEDYLAEADNTAGLIRNES